MLKQDDTHTHKKTHVAGGLDCKADTTRSKVGSNYNLSRYLFKPALILFFAVAYVPIYCSFMLALFLLPASLSNRLINWLAAREGI